MRTSPAHPARTRPLPGQTRLHSARTRRGARATIAAVTLAALAALAACGQVADPDGGNGVEPGAPGPATENAGNAGNMDGAARLEQQARDALARWDAAVAAAGDGQSVRFVPAGPGAELTDLVGEWEPELAENGKLALSSGLFEAEAGALDEARPAPGEVRWADGVTLAVPVLSATAALQAMRQVGCGPCDGTPVALTGATLTMTTVSTNRGEATVPAWEYTVRGSAVRIVRVAVEQSATVDVTPPPWDPYNAPGGLRPDSATVAADGRTVTVRFVGGRDGTGPCTSQYTARAIESDNAAVVVIDEHPDLSGGPDQACNAIGYARTATLTLAEPLGERTLLDVVQGMPVARE